MLSSHVIQDNILKVGILLLTSHVPTMVLGWLRISLLTTMLVVLNQVRYFLSQFVGLDKIAKMHKSKMYELMSGSPVFN